MENRQAKAHHPTQLIPVVPQPQGMAFFYGTWAGRLISLNTLLFLLTASWHPQEFFLSSDLDVLIRYGAKDNVLLAQGEIWRFFTPMFLHSGLLHFAFNNWAIYVVAYQMEFQLGPKLFLLLYLGAGIGGNIASAVLRSLSISVGASGALFGLLGFGLYLERVVQSRVFQATGSKPKAGAYTTMAVGNIVIGFLIPQIDNSAHVGGLVVGMAFGYIWLRYVPNRLLPLRRMQSRLTAATVLLLFAAGAALGSSRRYVLYELEGAIQSADRVQEKYLYLSRLIELDPEYDQGRLHRLTLALRLRDYALALDDLRYLNHRGGYELRLKELETELARQGFLESAQWLQESQQVMPQSL